MKITKSSIRLNSKPTTKEEMWSIDKSFSVIEVSINSLKKIVLENTFILGEMKISGKSITNNDWISQQVFAIDIDDNKSVNDFILHCKKYSFEPNIIYSTFSDKPEYRKWRAIWVLDTSVNDYDEALYYRTSLIKMFDSDKSCKDAKRLFYPGKDILYVNDTITEFEYFRSIIESSVIEGDNGLTRKLLKKRTTYNNNIEGAVLQQIPETIRKFDFNQNCLEVKIMDYFFNGNNRLLYRELFGLATNLQYIEGGLNYMKKKMDLVNSLGGGLDIEGKISKYEPKHYAVLKSVKNNYLPMMLENFSPFDEEYHNILDSRGFKRGRIDIIEQEQKIELIEAENKMKMEFKRVVDKIIKGDIFDLDPKIYIFKLSTGIGKTELLTNVEGALIASPTNNLKDELGDRMKCIYEKTPDYPIFSSIDLNDKLSNLHNCGLYTLATNIIKVISDGKYENITSEDTYKANEYLNINKICRMTNETVLTTHRRAISDTSFKHNLIIFDEDPLNSMIEIGSSSLDFSLFDASHFKNETRPIEDYYRNKFGEMYIDKNPKFNVSDKFKEVCAEINRGDIIKLLDADYIYKSIDRGDIGTIKYSIINKFKLDKNIIIMSATAPVEIYEKLYPGKVEVIDITNIIQTGRIEQYTNRGYSSSALSKYKKDGKIEDIKNDITKIISSAPVITHMKHIGIFEKTNKSNFYFGNCSGSDILKGKDIAVVGTPHKPQYVYYFYAKYCDISLKQNDTTLVDKTIDWKGFRFRYMTYENKDLRDIQLGLAESELIQAIGRNRTLRYDCISYVFSNLPLKVTTDFK
jgi:hypothetical protein